MKSILSKIIDRSFPVLIVLLVVAVWANIILIGCNNSGTESYERKQSIDNLKLIVIDSCEYYQFRTYNLYFGITHKGNCKYCKERSESLTNK